MSIAEIKALLQTALPAVPVVTSSAPSVSVQVNTDSIRLNNLIQTVIPDQVYPFTTKEKRVYPDCVYKIGGSSTYENFHTTTGNESIFVALFRDNDYDRLTTTVDAVSAKIDLEGGIEITDLAGDYNEQSEAYEIALELIINTPVGFNGSTGIMLIAGNCSAAPNVHDNCLVQEVECYLHCVIHGKTDADIQQIRASISASLLGYTENKTTTKMEYHSGAAVESNGGLKGWIETYRNIRIINE